MTHKPTIADQLRKAIANSGASEYAIAKASEVDMGVLSRFVRGERTITLATAAKLCSHLGLRLSQ
jgi:plasmid maintenance system antidote protein VapI